MLVLDEAMVALCHKADRLARGAISILLLGETGVGKERIAARIHAASGRGDEPFVAVNCAAVNPNLFESELFGFERGAFTGAERAKPGWLELAGAGTVFLDEVGELPLDGQAKLLRAIESATVTPVGATSPRPIRARFVAATNRDLAAAVERREFRDDLYYRLAGATLVVPALRDRPKEILPIARAFAAKVDGPRVLASDAEAALLRHRWPGNIRELRNVVERAALLAEGPSITAADLGLLASAPGAPMSPEQDPSPSTLAPRLAALSTRGDLRGQLEAALQAANGNQRHAAALLGVSRATLCRHLAKLGLSRPRRPAPVALEPVDLDRVGGGGRGGASHGDRRAAVEALRLFGATSRSARLISVPLT
jgi:two-component system, NtrC family, response regulator AtoC